MSGPAKKVATAAIPRLISQVRDELVPNVINFSKPRLQKFVYYARVELMPPKPTEIPQVIDGFRALIRGVRTQKWRDLTVKQTWINTLVATEVICWFFVGECIGKWKIVGYDV